MDKKRSFVFLLAAAFCLLSGLSSLCFGAARLSFAQLWQALLGGPKDTVGFIFWYSRLPRTAACFLAGSALAVSGCILQSVLRNHLASPGIIGVNGGAGLAVTLCCAFGALSGWTVALAAFAGAVASVIIVVLLAQKTGASRTTVILAGVAMNSILTAMRDAITTLVPDTAMLSGDFRVGDLSSVVSTRLLPAGVLICAALLIAATLCNELDVLALGEDTAQSLGLPVKRMRTFFLFLAALLAGAAVSFAGLLGFVGLLVPHIARRFVGSESRNLIPFSVFLGAGFVTVCDLLSRTMFAPHELPVGILMSVIGGPFFLVLLLKRKGGRSRA